MLVFLYAYIFLNSKCEILYMTFYNLFHVAIYCDNVLIIKLICVRKLVKIKITSNHTAQRQPPLIFWFADNLFSLRAIL